MAMRYVHVNTAVPSPNPRTMPAKKTMDRQGSGREAPHAVPAPAASRRLPRMSTMARLLAKARARAAT